MCIVSFFLILFFFLKIFIYVWLLRLACGILKFTDQGWNPRPLHWKRRVLTAGLLGKSHYMHF